MSPSLPALLFTIDNHLGAVQRRAGIRHTANRREPAGGRGSCAGSDRFLIFKAGLPQVAVEVDKSRTDNQSSGRQGIIGFTDRILSALADPADFIVFNQQIPRPGLFCGRDRRVDRP